MTHSLYSIYHSILAWRTRDAQLLHVMRHVYTNTLPRSAWDEILIEKSPQAGFQLIFLIRVVIAPSKIVLTPWRHLVT